MIERSACTFCRIVDGTMAARMVHTGERVVAFHDIDPKAPTHVLVVSREHYENVTEFAAAEPAGLVELVAVADRIAVDEGHGGQYRLVFNTGAGVGQSVFHLHAHVLSGRRFTWPPG